MSQSRLTVRDISYEACRATVEGALQGLPGVAAVEVDLDRKLVRVQHDDSLTPVGRLAAAIEEQGHPVATAERL